MLTNLFIFAASLFLVIRASTYATRYAARFAESLNLSKYAIGFIVIAIISILPETFISINAALTGMPSFGLGMLLGSNVADLTLVFVLVILLAGRSLSVESKVLKSHALYPFILLLPIILGLDGFFTRTEGVVLIVAGCIFYYLALRDGGVEKIEVKNTNSRYKNLFLLLLSLIGLLVGAHLTVSSASSIAYLLGVSPVVVGMLIVGLGTTMPEFFFSLKSVRQNDDSLAIGDVLGTVLADATIVIGLIAVITPFEFPKKIIYIGGVFMFAAALILMSFMRSGKTVTKKEAFALLVFWLTFVMVEFIVNL